ncbi:unnamed protein product [Paramecium pentaurelia]|uniref:Uncharacterized protein n=1 Tax=Paramecium pentaurelia TaxID=43138 RepID=A0A8S1T174_9CILI|nr:unnamed protein product [Paramecium pentaurelia]
MLNSSIYSSPNTQKHRSSSMMMSLVYGTSVSPNKSRVIQLSEKLSQLSIDEDRTLKKETYEEKLNSINQKVQKAHQNDLSRLQSLQEQLSKIEETLRNDQIIRNTNSKNFHQNTLKEQEKNVQQSIQKDKINRKTFEMRLTKLMDEQSYKMRLELARQQQYRKETEEQYKIEIEHKIENLSQDVRNEKREREMIYQEFVRRMGEQVFSVSETLNLEKKQRSESQNQMEVMIQEINNILNLQLAEEQIQRDETERTMIRLLNETCNRVESSLRK